MFKTRSFFLVLSFAICSSTVYGAASSDSTVGFFGFKLTLACAVRERAASTVATLLSQPLVQDYLKSNPSNINGFLMRATHNDDLATFQVLYNGGNVPIDMLKSIRDRSGKYLIQLAAGNSFSITEFLINLDPVFAQAVHEKYEMGMTLLHISVLGDSNWRTTDFLLKKGVNPNAVDNCRITPVHLAARKLDWRYLNILLQHGADLYALDDQDNSPLYYAAMHRRSENVKLLLVDPKQINYQNKIGKTPLIVVHEGVLDADTIATSQLLFDAGADKEMPTYTGKTALQTAAMLHDWDSVELLLEAPLPEIYDQPFRLD